MCNSAPSAGDLPDLSAVPPDLAVPEVTYGAPQPGRRVRQTTVGWEGTSVHHALYLPTDWRPGARYPVIVEYAGNGGYKNAFGDVSDGTVEGSRMGYGLAAGKGVIWICLPFVEVDATGKRNAPKWWGDVEETKRYCLATVKATCAEFGGDPKKVVVAGFSRGSIAGNFIGLHDDAIAALWCGFFCHSHYDGVRENWPYPGADRVSAAARLRRLNGRPQWISHEGSVAPTQEYLRGTGIAGAFTFETLNFRNHSGDWVLRDVPERRAARRWLEKILAAP
ncbi:MAG: hypothetical protein EXS37_15590 [Opitutus sp.]|nr:hypothetical protein [Opitutus sp.]